MTSWRDSLLFVVNTRIQIRLMLQGKARSTLERAEEEARRVSEFAPGSLPDVGLTLLSARWLTLLAVLRDANSDLLLHASVLSCLAASGYALADLSRAFLQLHPLFTSSLYIVVAAAYLVDSVIYVLSWQGNAYVSRSLSTVLDSQRANPPPPHTHAHKHTMTLSFRHSTVSLPVASPR